VFYSVDRMVDLATGLSVYRYVGCRVAFANTIGVYWWHVGLAAANYSKVLASTLGCESPDSGFAIASGCRGLLKHCAFDPPAHTHFAWVPQQSARPGQKMVTDATTPLAVSTLVKRCAKQQGCQQSPRVVVHDTTFCIEFCSVSVPILCQMLYIFYHM
jgi:hypothetical protein